MQWWAWVAIGAILLGSELAFVDAQFYLVFVGGAAFVVGFVELTGLSLAVWLQWLLFAFLAGFGMLAFRRRIYEYMRRNLPASTLAAATMVVSSVAFVNAARPVDRSAARAGLPLVAWLGFATVLTATIWKLNSRAR